METTISYVQARIKLGSDVQDIARPIAYNFGLAHLLEDIIQDTRTSLLEDYNRYAGIPGYLDKMDNEQYYNTAVRNKVINICHRRSDPFTYYYQPEWVRDNLDLLLAASVDTELAEVVDFRRAFDTLTDRQRDAILAGSRSGNASKGIDKIVYHMNKGKPNYYVNINELEGSKGE